MKITPLGGAEEVGRSSFLVDTGEKILFEHGIKLGAEHTEYPSPVQTHLDSVVLSHAHLDHSGFIPYLFLNHKFPSFMTHQTLDLSSVLWYDTLKIEGLENKIPRWTKTEIEKTRKYTFSPPYKSRIEIAHNTFLKFLDAGHILGSSLCEVQYKEFNLLYTGDFKLNETSLHNGCDLSSKPDILITESTYGDREQIPRKKTEKDFVESIKKVIDSGGLAVIPAFAVGRSQEVLQTMYEYNLDAPIYLDGMGKKVANIYLENKDLVKNPKDLQKSIRKAILVTNKKTRKEAMQKGNVVVTTAGMLQGGPAHLYINEIYNDSNSAIFLTGYQVEGTPGRRLMDTGKMVLEGQDRKVKAQVRKFEFSTHADQVELIKSIKKWSPKQIILGHGDKIVVQKFKQKIKDETGIETIIAEKDKTIDIKL